MQLSFVVNVCALVRHHQSERLVRHRLPLVVRLYRHRSRENDVYPRGTLFRLVYKVCCCFFFDWKGVSLCCLFRGCVVVCSHVLRLTDLMKGVERIARQQQRAAEAEAAKQRAQTASEMVTNGHLPPVTLACFLHSPLREEKRRSAAMPLPRRSISVTSGRRFPRSFTYAPPPPGRAVTALDTGRWRALAVGRGRTACSASVCVQVRPDRRPCKFNWNL